MYYAYYAGQETQSPSQDYENTSDIIYLSKKLTTVFLCK